ncbi:MULTISPECIES: CtsR family transcriptional regulator [Enterococcus]|uniref:Transcriptional regulator CtsR n=1 Tax=Candidatus Enterococcus mangumiae TaxID=2230878 RepID=A0ABZ2SV44_9ENTE|nr:MULTISPECIES: CtsR family transcriptional regulator [unclassified Enterococcus]MBO0462698.1 CtsR family transcriptional regulator [Enterococcus sp. DIV1298c]MBO0491448.1 CtsR family transcriptional regulator [Enterococcus sp. DIV1094]MBO1298899.1 CtsR family transcriptional regulator [Enterococcus sp. DIV1271a]
MAQQNTSDLIESYIKKILEKNEMIELRRIELADLFNCVPSQINYVINTRFTIQRGYLVESKRGGGGYIRIAKVRMSDKKQMLERINLLFGETINEKNAYAIIQKLYEDQIITKKEGNLMLSAIAKNTLNINETEDYTRARILRAFLERLSYEDGK